MGGLHILWPLVLDIPLPCRWIVSGRTAHIVVLGVRYSLALQVDSQWEDCLYRVEALNILLFMVDSLTEGINSVKKYMEIENYENDIVRNMIGEILDNLSESLDQPLPELPVQGFTKLDKLVWDRREKEWTFLQEDSENLRRNLSLKPHQELLVEVEDFMLRLKALAIEVSERAGG